MTGWCVCQFCGRRGMGEISRSPDGYLIELCLECKTTFVNVLGKKSSQNTPPGTFAQIGKVAS